MRKFIAAVALMLGVFFLLTRFTAINEVAGVLKRGNIFFLSLALLVEAAWIYNLGAFYQSIYRVLGMEVRRTHVMKLVTSGCFLTVVAPSAGLSAIAVYLDDAQRNGRSIARVTVASVLYVWFEFIGTLAMALFGMVELSRRSDLHWAEITATLVLVAGALGIGMVLYLGMRSAKTLGKVLAWLTRLVNAVAQPFIHRDYLKVQRAYEFSREVAEGIAVLRSNPRWVSWPFFFTFLNKALLIGVLACCFLAFQVPLDLGTLVAGQSIAHMFLIVSPTPAGIGFVEGILALALKSLGVPLGNAAVITVAYRGFSFWTPFFFGMLMFRSLGGFGRAPEAAAEANTLD